MTDTASTNPANPSFGFPHIPGESDIKKWVGDAVSPLTDPIKTVVGDIKGEVDKVLGHITHPLADDWQQVITDVGNIRKHVPDFAKVASTMGNFGATSMSWDAAKGQQAKAALNAFTSQIADAVEQSFAKLGAGKETAAALRKVEAALASVEDELAAPLALIAELVDLDDAAQKIQHLPQLIDLKQQGRAPMIRLEGAAPGDPVSEIVISVVIMVLSMIVEVLDYIRSSFPLSIGAGLQVGASGGVAIGVDVEGDAAFKGSVGLLGTSNLVIGLLALPLKVLITTLPAVMLDIDDADSSSAEDKIDAVQESLGAKEADKAHPPADGTVQKKLDLVLGQVEAIMLKIGVGG